MTKKTAKAKATKKRSRPTTYTYTAEIGQRICERVAMREPLSKICSEPGMPSPRQLFRWKLEHPEFAENLAKAREHRAESRSDYIDDIVEQVRLGKLDPNSARVMIQAEQWQASKELPRRYADRVELTGKDGGPVAVAVNDDAALIRTARWVADLLVRANDAPAEKLQNGSAAIDALALPAPNNGASR